MLSAIVVDCKHCTATLCDFSHNKIYIEGVSVYSCSTDLTSAINQHELQGGMSLDLHYFEHAQMPEFIESDRLLLPVQASTSP